MGMEQWTSRRVPVAVIASPDEPPVAKLVGSMAQHLGYAVVVLGAAPSLAEILRGTAALPVVDVAARTRLEPDHVYVVPAGREARLWRGELVTTASEAPIAPVDRLLRSLAEELGPQATGVLLSGAGSDGVIGLKRLKEAGGSRSCSAPRSSSSATSRAPRSRPAWSI
jgi:chemotaxis response regulator CheB